MSSLYKKTCIECTCDFVGAKNQVYCPDCRRKLNAKKIRMHRHRKNSSKGGVCYTNVPPGGSEVGRGITHTQSEAAEYFGCTRQCIQQIEKSALRKLRKALERMGIKDFASFGF